MNQIKIGTCIPGDKAVEWLPKLADCGLESFAINFHMSLEGMDLKELADKIMPVVKEKGVSVTTVGYYCNALDNPEHKKTLEYVIDSAKYFGAGMVSTFAGACEGESVEKSMPQFGRVFGELASRAESENVKIAIENCPMGGTWNKNTCNIGFNPRAWEMMFSAVPSDNLGLEWEPGHQSIQLIDPVTQLREWAPKGKIFHLHGKDCNVYQDVVEKYGIFGAKEFAVQRLPGFGDTDWRQIFTILYENNYDSDICVEGYHDPLYSGEWEMTGQLHALKYLRWCRGEEFTQNPW